MMHELDPRILQYYDNEFSPEEREAFLLELEENPRLKEEWRFYGVIIEGIKAQGIADLKEYIKENSVSAQQAQQQNLWMYAAATVTVLLLSYFAIYSYLETGNIKEATRIITLKDEKSKRIKFWNRRSKEKTGDAYTNVEKSPYEDSMRLLDQEYLDNSPPLASEDTDYPTEEVRIPPIYEPSAAPALSGDNRFKNQDKQSILTNQIQLVSIKLSDIPIKEDKKPALTKEIETSTAKVKLEKKIPVIENRLEPNIHSTKDSNEFKKQGIQTVRTTPQRFRLKHFESDQIKPSIRLVKAGGVTELDLYNLWGENPLIYEINGEYYLDLGSNHIWKIPSQEGTIEKIEWVKDKNVIELIRN
jgi:hypothetical protein